MWINCNKHEGTKNLSYIMISFSLGRFSRKGWLYKNCVYQCLWNFHTVFYISCIYLQWTRGYVYVYYVFFPTPWWAFIVLFGWFGLVSFCFGFDFWILTFLTRVREASLWFCLYFAVANDPEHIFLWLLAICISSFWKCLFMPFAHFLTGLFV